MGVLLLEFRKLRAEMVVTEGLAADPVVLEDMEGRHQSTLT